MFIKDADIVGYRKWLKFIWKGHISNWLWRDSLTRRLVRQKYYSEMKGSYFNKYLSFVENLHACKRIKEGVEAEDEKIFSLWLQGEANAPEIVKRCLASIRRRYGGRFILLDESTLQEYITLPETIERKWKNKQISAANFSDIVRIELLNKYGGYWFDATDLLIAPIPEFIEKADFFMYITSPTLYTHMFVQTCFIRSKKGDPLMQMWRDLVFHYWENEERSADYFLVHMLFRYLVTHNEEAGKLFDSMPKVYQDDIQLLWFTYGDMPFKMEYLEIMKEKTFFQKCSYRKLKHAVKEIMPGSTADILSGQNEDQLK